MDKFDEKINSIIELLCLDVNAIINNVQQNNIHYDFNDQEIATMLFKIEQHDNSELIHNNLYELNTVDNVPEFLKNICNKYSEHLQEKQKKVHQPINYNRSVIDYINAANAESKERILQAENKVIESEKKLKKLLYETQKNKKEFEEKIIKSKDSIILLTVTVLGIFSSLTFSLSGSLGILNNIFNSGDSFAESLFKYSLIGIFVANLVFLLIYTISKLNNKSIAMHCAKCKTISSICKNCDIRTKQPENDFEFKKDCHGCEHKNTSCLECTKTHKGILCKLWNKFNYIFIINILCIFFLIFSFVLGVTGHSNFVFEREINNVEQSQVGPKNEQVVIIENKNQKDNVDANLNNDVNDESIHPDKLASDEPIETPLEKSDN